MSKLVFNSQLVMKKLFQISIGIFLIFFAQLTLPILFEFEYDIRFTWTILGIVAYFSLVRFDQIEVQARNAFFFIAIFGTVIALIRPVQYALDEETHLKNTIGLSDSFLFRYSDEELKDYEAVFLHDGIRNVPNYKGKDYFDQVEHQDSQVAGEAVGFDNPAYLPSVVGWNLGEVLSDRVAVSYYLGRIGTVLAYAALVYLAIRTSLVYKDGIYLLGTLPSALYVTAGFHYDYLYYGCSLLLVAILTNILSGHQQLTLRRALTMQGLALGLVFAKFPYVLLGLLPLIIPAKHCADKRVKPVATLSFGVMFLLAVVYAGIINVFKVSTFVSSESPGLTYFISHPLPIIRTFIDAPVVIVQNFVSRPLQYVSHDSPLLLSSLLVTFSCLYLVIALKSRIRLSTGVQFLLAGLIFVIGGLTIYAITGDPRAYNKGDILVGGVQGRYYFFPLAIFPIFLGDWIQRWLALPELSLANSHRLTTFIQYAHSFLMIFTISVALYTQI